ncbi:MAG: copper chaperone PCu(A)C [Confluentimicrobium sp.]|jgi:copper(I)-binding protein|uniref:copper chaperone PCu(A)C n=1 Tax=Actibacterium sp. TaxID=1872125 RepID=UPI00050F2073|nr:copper chaperone PCu(A)C [Actibacterium sp.]KGB80544.1 copper-binding protein [Rhodovulum sp. NI22]MBC56243.1 copper chaperone PCu(A)C [Actibacterium sp.]MDY6860578.1 copper chaperone PCu(A)C [Pseudomonadota bacterium]|tara:strand:+ start:194 stop:679 length:486 start_codon:yes stop_codon:yes gene_type:complete
MSLKKSAFAALAAISFALPALADGIMIEDPYARASTMMSQSGAAFMVLKNMTDSDDRLVGASSDVAERVELHTHISDAQGVMQMVEVEEGFPIPAGGSHALARGGDHVMFLGLTRPLQQGDVIQVTLSFEKAGDITVDIPVDLQRKPMHGQMNHGTMKMTN